ncbi:hypothetical protein D3H65_18175 [Paraflavitalea soli]|uniref:Aspartyl protease n=1 Tax=Paraflavitalea soli TaxID=2315862 RepID=A0A3B7MZU2_9BACT|nr:hypothetical protein [Paraflavitalea soli]AXY75791.1 hypothetical protein D3H65_18175 [Paraflavitalea soli]
MKKQLLPTCLLFLFLFQYTRAQVPPPIPANQLIFPAGTHILPLQWKGDSLHSQWEPQAGLLIPVTIPGCPKTWYMQFDTGSPYSLFYGDKLQAIYRRYPSMANLRQVGDTLTNFSFKAGPLPITARQIAVQSFDSSGIDWSNKHSLPIIGTLGTDLIDNKAVAIDYRRKQLIISDSLPVAYRKAPPVSFTYAMRRILLPAVIRGQKTILYFDSGSSAFELLTNKATCLQLAIDTAAVIQYPVQSWGKTLIANTVATNDSITLAGKAIPIRRITWVEGVNDSQVSQMMKMGIGGMTGNKLFLHNILVLDTRSRQFRLF